MRFLTPHAVRKTLIAIASAVVATSGFRSIVSASSKVQNFDGPFSIALSGSDGGRVPCHVHLSVAASVNSRR
jgi:hypothetical protein